jgi:predicted ATPase
VQPAVGDAVPRHRSPEEPVADKGVLLGRERELDELRAAYRAAAGGVGSPQLVLITGIAGIGKSTLCAALADEAEAGGALVLGGCCPRSLGVPMAYAPFVAA